MKSGLLALVIKYLLTLLLFTSILYYSIISSASNILEDESLFLDLKGEFFIIFYFRGLFGDWGVSWQNGEEISELLKPILTDYFIFLLPLLLVLAILGYFILFGLAKWNLYQKLTIFRSNWLFYACSFLILYSALFIIAPGSLIFDSFVDKELFNSSAFYFYFMFMTILGLSKFLHNASMIPSSQSLSADLGLKNYTYPENKLDSDENSETNNNNIDKEQMINPFNHTIIAMKSTVINIIEISIIVEPTMNLRLFGSFLIRAIVFSDVPFILSLLFILISTILVLRLTLDLILWHQHTSEEEHYQTFELQRLGNQTIFTQISRIMIYAFLILSFISAIIWFLTGFNFNFLIFSGPEVTRFNQQNLPIFTNGFILGTDRSGRDRFTFLFLHTAIYFIPVLLSILCRFTLIYATRRIPDIYEENTAFHIFDSLQSLPKLPILLIVNYITFLNQSNDMLYLTFSFVVPFLFWGDIGKYSFTKVNGVEIFNIQKYKLFIYSALSITIELILLDFVFLWNVSDYSWGVLLYDAFSVAKDNLSILVIILLGPIMFFSSAYFRLYSSD